MNPVQETDRPLLDAIDATLSDAALPALRALADTLDREFARREPQRQSAVDWAAERLDVTVAEVAILSEQVDPPVAHAIGCWLFAVLREHSAAQVGADPTQPASTELVRGAAGDVRAFRAVTAVVPAGVLHQHAVVLRISPVQYTIFVELFGRRDDDDELADLFASFLRVRRTTDSPYRLGNYRVSTDSRGLVLKRAVLASATRETLMLDDGVWATVDRHVHQVLTLAEDLRSRGLGTSTGVLLVGPPGTGKTQLGTVIAGELSGTATVLVPGSYVTEHYLTELFDLAADLAPTLILMDDLDLIAGERGQTNPHRLREFLNVMDGGLSDRSGVVVVASTNDHRKIDKAARRSSRFDTVITMEAPGYEGRLAILRRYLGWTVESIDVAAVARATDGATGADLKELVRATVLATSDHVTTDALIAQSSKAHWSAAAAPVGVYL